MSPSHRGRRQRGIDERQVRLWSTSAQPTAAQAVKWRYAHGGGKPLDNSVPIGVWGANRRSGRTRPSPRVDSPEKPAFLLYLPSVPPLSALSLRPLLTVVASASGGPRNPSGGRFSGARPEREDSLRPAG